jgi:hypothetical protein
VVIDVIEVHALDGREVIVNTAQITQVIEARKAGNPHKMLDDKVTCVIVFTDRRWVSTKENCDEILKLLRQEQAP